MTSPTSSSLETVPSDIATGAGAATAAPDTNLVSEFAELLKKLTAKEVTALRAGLTKLDVKEKAAAEKYLKSEREARWLKKLREARQKKKWVCIKEEQVSEEQRVLNENLVKHEALKEVDLELGQAVVPQCYEEIKHLLFIEKDPVYAKALEEWSRKELLLTSRVERKKTKAADLKNEIYQLIGFFSVFQGVVLTAVSQSNLLHCNNLWSPIFLSVVASVVTIFGVIQKLFEIEKFQTTIHSEENSLKKVTGRLSLLRTLGVEKFEFARFGSKDAKKVVNIRSKVYFWLVIASLVVFTVGFPISHWRILCDSGDAPYKVSN